MRAAAVLLVALAVTGCGSGTPEREQRFDPFTDVRDRTVERERRTAPRWERLTTLAGSGPAREAFTVERGAIQWRARWRCRSGRLELSTASGGLVDARCPGRGVATGVRTGALELAVDASGPWRVDLEQQVDTPLREPPLAAMRSPEARVVSRGRFYDLERRGRGSASLYRLPGGRLALRLERFATSNNTDLFVWLSTAARPRTTVQAARAGHTVLAELKATVGEQNYLLPSGFDAADARSIVIWCVPVRIAYTAASLRAR